MIGRVSLCFALLAMLANSALAASFTVFGIELGKPLSLPECARKESYGISTYVSQVDAACFKNYQNPYMYGGHTVRWVLFPDGEKPSIVSGGVVVAFEVGGTVEGIEFDTNGIESQGSVMEALVGKFGKPKNVVKHNVQSIGGAKFDSVFATWAVSGVAVQFFGTLSRLDTGRVIINTKSGAAQRARWAEEREKEKIKF